jgi:hypothetical protein
MSIGVGALAGGVLWCFISVALPYDTNALIIPIGGLLGLFLRWQGFRTRAGIIAAAAAILLAFIYAQFLFGAVRIAQLMGFPLRQVLFKADTVLIVNAAWVDLQDKDWIYLALAAALGMAVVGYRHTARQPAR